MTRPSLDKIGGWIERGFANFIVGEGETPKPSETNGKEASTFSGPFAQYSTISSAASSTAPSPQMSTTNLAEMPAAPPFRSGSAMALRPSSGTGTQIARASSAIDYLRRKPSPVPRVTSASAMSSSFGDLPAIGQHASPYGYGYVPDNAAKIDGSSVAAQENEPDTPSGPHLGTWWGDSGAPTPTAASFSQHDTPATTSSEGFISLMDSAPHTFTTPVHRGAATTSSHLDDVDEEDDLGLGNSSNRTRARQSTPVEENEVKPAAQPTKAESQKEAEKPGECCLSCVHETRAYILQPQRLHQVVGSVDSGSGETALLDLSRLIWVITTTSTTTRI